MFAYRNKTWYGIHQACGLHNSSDPDYRLAVHTIRTTYTSGTPIKLIYHPNLTAHKQSWHWKFQFLKWVTVHWSPKQKELF